MNETNNSNSAFKTFPLILLCYLAPLFALIILSRIIPDGLNIIALGLLVTAAGALTLYQVIQRSAVTIIKEMPLSTPEPVYAPLPPPVDLTPFETEIASLKQSVADYENKTTEWHQQQTHYAEAAQELEQLKQENEALHKQLQSAVARYRELQESQSAVIQEHQQKIAELRDDLAQRQQMGDQLEGKVRDLSYELKTLLRLAEKPIHGDQKVEPISVALAEEEALSHPVQTHEEARVQLKRSLDIAQRVTGAGYLTSSPKFQEFALENSALDLRRLIDKLQDIENNALIVFSPKENKLLYVNERTKELLGISIDRFKQAFQDFIQSDYEEWKTAIQQLSFKNDAHVTLPIAIRPGEILHVECLLGVIQTGLFRNNVIALLYTTRS